jgi:hypothetical protein
MPTHFKRICLAIDELPPNLDFEVFKLQFLILALPIRASWQRNPLTIKYYPFLVQSPTSSEDDFHISNIRSIRSRNSLNLVASSYVLLRRRLPARIGARVHRYNSRYLTAAIHETILDQLQAFLLDPA